MMFEELDKIDERYRFLYRCAMDRFNPNFEVFSELFEKCGSDMEKFAEEIIRSDDPAIRKSQAYAVASKEIDPDGRHWYRIREMVGDRCRKTYSDSGSLKIGSPSCTFLIPNGQGDGTMRYAVLEKGEFNFDMVDFFASVEGDEIAIYSYDCGNEVAETISGRYGIYNYSGFVIFEKWD